VLATKGNFDNDEGEHEVSKFFLKKLFDVENSLVTYTICLLIKMITCMDFRFVITTVTTILTAIVKTLREATIITSLSTESKQQQQRENSHN